MTTKAAIRIINNYDFPTQVPKRRIPGTVLRAIEALKVHAEQTT